MNINQIHYVLQIAKQKSFSRASSALKLSQPALSQQIRRLEDELGIEIFRRTQYGAELTPQGEIFVQEAEKVSKAWSHLEEVVGSLQGQETLHLRIALGARVYSNDLFQGIVDYFDQKPEIEVSFLTEIGGDFFEQLKENQVDLVVDRLPAHLEAAGSRDIFVEKLLEEEQCLLVSEKHPLAQKKGVTFEDLQGCTMVTGLKDSLEDRTLKYLRDQHGLKLRSVYRTDGLDAMMDLVRSGKGVLLGPVSCARFYHVKAIPLLPETYVDLNVMCLKEKAMDPEIRAFREYLLGLVHRPSTNT